MVSDARKQFMSTSPSGGSETKGPRCLKREAVQQFLHRQEQGPSRPLTRKSGVRACSDLTPRGRVMLVSLGKEP
jgi:hypothetical protein